MPAFIDLTGLRFGLWLVQRYLPGDTKTMPRRKGRWFCVCECGVERPVDASNLVDGQSLSCGCQNIGITARTPALKRTSGSYYLMRRRCRNPKDASYLNYGGRGIRVCDRWLHSFEDFLADMGECPLGYSIERVNVNGNYEPSNCTWIPKADQAKNRRPWRPRARLPNGQLARKGDPNARTAGAESG